MKRKKYLGCDINQDLVYVLRSKLGQGLGNKACVTCKPLKNQSWTKAWFRRLHPAANAVMSRMSDSPIEGPTEKSDKDFVQCDACEIARKLKYSA